MLVFWLWFWFCFLFFFLAAVSAMIDGGAVRTLVPSLVASQPSSYFLISLFFVLLIALRGPFVISLGRDEWSWLGFQLVYLVLFMMRWGVLLSSPHTLCIQMQLNARKRCLLVLGLGCYGLFYVRKAMKIFMNFSLYSCLSVYLFLFLL
ncbi:hypothetical protein BJX70DRAFT_124274 [Aspergillus crustosus]